jgi:hypothetical protein
MNWDAIATIAELIGAAGVIASLVYVAAQIRDNTRSSRIQQRQESTRQFVDFMDLLLLNPDLADLHDRGRDLPEELDTEELKRFRRIILRGFWYFSAQFHQYKIGALGDDEWSESARIIRSYLRHKGIQDWWYEGDGQSYVSPSFAAYVDGELASVESRG